MIDIVERPSETGRLIHLTVLFLLWRPTYGGPQRHALHPHYSLQAQ